MIEQLFREASEFEFFQAVRLLERLVARDSPPTERRQPVGKDGSPRLEAVRFRALPSLSFPASDVTNVRAGPPSGNGRGADQPPPEMTVTMFGMTGPSGVLPHHYTALVLERLRQRDRALAEFLDLFNHRAISHFVRAWEKYRLPFAFERASFEQQSDSMTECLYCLVGLGTAGLRGRMAVADETLLFYSGHFVNQTRSANALETMLSDYFDVPLRVRQFQGQWLYLTPPNRSRLAPSEPRPTCHARLGADVVLGERVWDIQSKFRVEMGPLTYEQFRGFLPSSQRLAALVDLTRAFAGPEFDFDVQLRLEAGEVPKCCLGGTSGVAPHLGWNTWLYSQEFTSDVADAVFGEQESASAE